MNQGIALLIARMDSNPEEFGSNATRGGRWHYLLAPLLGEDRPKQSWATKEEIEAVRTKYYSIQGETFTKHVLKELLEDERKDAQQAWLGTTTGRLYGSHTTSVLSTLGRADIERAYNAGMAGLKLKEDK